jgi:hypothetical protein
MLVETELRIVQKWGYDKDGILIPVTYHLQIQTRDGWKNVPVINKFPEPEQMELPLEDRPRI